MRIFSGIIATMPTDIHNPDPAPTDGNYYVTAAGTGTGLITDPMGPGQFITHGFQANDNIFFNRGDSFILGNYDTAIAGLTFDAYGTGADPIIRGTNDISTLDWASEGSGIYSTPMVAEPSWIWIAGICAKNAETARLTVQGRADTTHVTVTHADVSAYTSIVDSYLVMKVNQFRNSQRVKVTAYDGAGSITIDGIIPTANNIDFVLYNKMEFLTGNNEWTWENGVLYVKAAASPSTLNIRMSAYDYGIKATASTIIQNLEICEYYHYAVHSENGLISVNNCNIHDCRSTAVYIEHQLTGANVSDNLIERIGNTAILTRPCITSTYNRNTVNDIGMQANYGWQTFSGGPASDASPGGTQVSGAFLAYVIDLNDDTIDGSGCEFNDNVINNIAYNAIGIHVGTTTMKALRNTCTQFTRRFSDGGGIYTFHYRDYNVLQTGTEIANNICINDDHEGYGIYLDNRTFQAAVHDNVTSGCLWGFNFNTDTAEHTIEDNISVDNTYSYTFRTGSNGTNFIAQNEGNTFNNNLAVAYTGQKCLFFDVNSGTEPTWNPYTGGGADNNMYVATGSEIADSDNKGNNLSLAALRTAYGQDTNSASRVESSRIFVYNATASPVNDSAGGGWETFAGVDTNAYTIPAHYAIVLFPIPISGFYTNSLQFVAASSQYVDVGTHAEVQFTHESLFTIVGWFKVPANPAGTVAIFDNRNGSNRGLVLNMLSTGALQFQMVNTVSTNRIQYVGSTDFADDQWHFVQISKTSTAVTSVVIKVDNATLSPSVANNLTATIASTASYLFARSNAGTHVDVELVGCALWMSNQNANSAAIYNSGVTHDLMLLASPPDHYWTFDNDITDTGASANALNGTAFNSPTFTTDVP